MRFNLAWLTRASGALALSICCLAPAMAAETWIVGPKPPSMTLQEAVRRAADGDTVALMPGEYRGQSAVVLDKRITIRALAERPVLLGAGQPLAENKALLVVRGGEVTVQKIEFRGARVPDANGAGIRHDRGKLVVRDCVFLDNENGILTGNEESAQLVVEDSEFGMAPRVEGGLHHLLYVGRIGSLSIRGSRFYSGHEGHLIKSRARENRIAYNLIYDGDEGQASYEIDLPNAGLAWIVGNIIGQGSKGQNLVHVAYGAERPVWPRNGLYVSHNTFVGNPWPPSWFVRVFDDRVPANTEVKVINNASVGVGMLGPFARGEFRGNVHAVRRRALESIYTLEFMPTADSGWRGSVPAAGQGGGESLVPRFEFKLPRGVRPIQPPTAWTPGALQSPP